MAWIFKKNFLVRTHLPRNRAFAAPGLSRYSILKRSMIFAAAAWLGPDASGNKDVPINAQAARELPSPLAVIDGDTISSGGTVYRLIGFDTPEAGNKAQCDSERTSAAKAAQRLSQLIAEGDVALARKPCACRQGTEGTRACNYGRLCGTMTARGRDAGEILISEGLAHPYLCGKTSCPRRQSWCG
ncbi:MAG: thermonuclease family protein [Beijerinckiaceae bacterium]|nr:thermonuclease family protein [Beijerinckiaceae bacterium]